jgi:hypothetical protein
MMVGGHPSATAAGAHAAGPHWAGSQAGQTAAGGKAADEEEIKGHGRTMRGGLYSKTRKEKGRVFIFLKSIKQMNSNIHLNSNTQKQYISMYATINSYSSLFN